MLECHCHLLPGVDDGAPDLATALALLTDLAGMGITEVVLTPHRGSTRVPVDVEAIAPAYASLLEAAAQTPATDALRLHLGAENHLSGVADPTRWAAEAIPLGDSNVVLIELPDDHLPANTWEVVFAVQRRGKRPLLAHPERCKGLAASDPGLARYVQSGGLLQLTVGHVIGAHGWRMRWRANRLRSRFSKSCILASDTHDRGPRRPRWDALAPDLHQHWPKDLKQLHAWI